MAHRLKQALRQAEITQEEFGSLLRVSRVTVSNWIRGVHPPASRRAGHLERLTSALEKAVADGRLPVDNSPERLVRVKRVLASYLRSM